MNDSSPPAIEEKPAAGRFPVFAATCSLLAPFVVFFLYLLFFWYVESHGRTRMVTLGLLGLLPLLLILLGIILGIVALALIKRQEHKGLFGVALAGVCINSLLVALVFIGPFF